MLDQLVEEAINVHQPAIDASDQDQNQAYRELRPAIVKTLMDIYYKQKQRQYALDDLDFEDDNACAVFSWALYKGPTAFTSKYAPV